jgi:hypothetical protein
MQIFYLLAAMAKRAVFQAGMLVGFGQSAHGL